MLDNPRSSCEPRPGGQYKRLYDQAARLAKIGAWECDLGTQQLTWTDGVYDLFALPRGSTIHRPSIVDLYEDESRQQMERLRAETIRTGNGFTLDARIRTSDDARRWMRLTAAVSYEHGRPVRLFGAKQDITEEKELWERLRRLAEQDSLTGLANRRVFESRCADLAVRAVNGGSATALVLIDLDNFKEINDRLGHSAGDECLRQVAKRLQRVFGDAILIARIGGDEFAMLLPVPLGRAQVARALARALHVLSAPIPWRNADLRIGASAGIAFLKRPRFQEPSQVFAEADSALYVAKAAGRNTVRIFGQSIDERTLLSVYDGFAGPALRAG
jgi:diguanylate cyclase (GGDEF)-like protein